MSKKGSKAKQPETSYAERDIVLAKVRGFPPWPGMVMNPDTVPPNVAKERPAGKKTTFHCIRFFPVGDYAWLVSKDISKLQQHEIEAYINEPYKKSGDLLTGYRIALDPVKWEKEKERDKELAAVEQEDNDPVDQLESDVEDGAKKPAKPKKRKRDSEAPAPKPKAKAKTKGEKKAPPTKGKRNGTKSKEMVESEDDGEPEAEAEEDEEAGSSAKAAPPPSKKPKREKEEDIDPALEQDTEAKKVREWRHKLQKALLGNKGMPPAEEMPALDQLFTTIENYDHPNLIQYLSFSKIGKVMRHIAALSTEKVPRDDEFKFRTRAKSMVDKWHAILGASKGSEVEGAVNGASADAGVPAEKKADNHQSSPVENGTTGPPAADVSLADATMTDA
ncbi:Tudor/PWWP/MBT [Rhizopogon vinicolor AM-OR11-026]|uniref:Tudor/PWWP/MBT n=1 Tax=Rhizopogon vinicolor AM-OR11-026 TaxID=1314800 RepID=A0A1B7N8G3_9AGAM|nr:Tudor/PWWP/MBT [Rhizopogon vinicolor AM-OR11-026]